MENFTKKGVQSVAIVKRVRVILCLDTSNKTTHLRPSRIAERVGLSRQAIYDIRDDFLASESIESFLSRKKRERPPVEPKITGEVEARLIALACSEPPKGCARWTLHLLAEKSVELNLVDSLSHMSAQRILKKRNFSLI